MVDGESAGVVSIYECIDVIENHTIEAIFDKMQYVITASAGENGTITPSGENTYDACSDVTYTIAPDACYAISGMIVDGIKINPQDIYTFENLDDNHTISVEFEPTEYIIKSSAGPGGTINPIGSNPAVCGGTETYTIR
ncbi:MAG: hypothetical protein JXJ04_13825 [Spirochaetales bacterium]|nr:hypothetical protein [Spirochaetales bacterium]